MLPEFERRTIAPPGCGKTTWLVRQGNLAAARGMNVAMYSMTKTGAAEIASRDMDGTLEAGAGEITTGTLHAQCHLALGRPIVAENASRIVSWNELVPDIWKLTAAKGKDGEDDAADGQPGHMGGDALMSAIRLLRGNLTPEADWPPEALQMEAAWREWKEREGLLDFTDMVEACITNTQEAPGKPQVILVDESQDMCWLEMNLIRHWGESAGMLVTVGDPDQAIYAWRGSDPEAFAGKLLPPDREQILNRSYRLSREVHTKAMEWIDRDPTRRRVEYHPRDEDGECRSLPYDFRQPAGILRDAERYIERGKSVMFLASCGYMLDDLIEEMRALGLPFHNPLRSTQGAWNPMTAREGTVSAAQRLAAFLNLSERGAWTAEDMRRWTGVAKVKQIVTQTSGRKLIDALEDDARGPGGDPELSRNLLASLMLPEALEAGETGDMEWYHNVLTSARRRGMEFPIRVANRGGIDAVEREPLAQPGTIHSAKGGEADVVYLFPDLSRQGAEEWNGTPRTRAGVYRMFYVGMTRARESLVLCKPHWNSAAAPELDG